MSELAFNELSLDTEVVNIAHATALLKTFFKLCDRINELKLGTLRLRTRKGFVGESFNGIHFTIHDFLKTLSFEDRTQYSTYLAQAPLITDNPYYMLEKTEVTGFGHAFETEGITISINNSNNWNKTSYLITREYLGESQDAEIEYVKKDVRHLPHEDHIINLQPYLTNVALSKARLDLKGIKSIEEFWDQRYENFRMLDFSPDSELLLHKFGSINNPNFIKAAKYLERLNLHLIEVSLKKRNFDEIPGDVSLESESTMNKYGSDRIFTLPSGKKVQFSLHAKIGGDLRIYLLPNEAEGKIIIGHIGNHLKTVRFN
ncbi:hypothetical protein [Chryseobacterium sp. SIMBA_029]|uniref:hypothetical protein n=1 Tax=Chryseobacterium sp. SIMBA_029 TaxID=3085772 RepID=UPI003978C34B